MLMALFKGKRHKFDHHCTNINQCFLFLMFAFEFACYFTRLVEHSWSSVGVNAPVSSVYAFAQTKRRRGVQEAATAAASKISLQKRTLPLTNSLACLVIA